MADKETILTLDTNQIATTDLAGSQPAPSLSVPQPTSDAPAGEPLYPPEGPNPEGTSPAVPAQMEKETQAKGENGTGVEGEEVVWEARYSMKNFLGRVVARTLLTLGWVALAIYTWVYDHSGVMFFTIMLGLFVVFAWVALLYRILVARCGHEYRLTNRRLFVSTGLMRRRRDQMELLRVKDVFTRQTLMDGWLSLGTVVVVPNESTLPTFYLAGVDEPKRVMDLVWHCARAEREGKSVQVENL